MGASDILPVDPDYTLPEQVVGGAVRSVADSGRVYQRLKKAPQRLFELEFFRRATDEAEQIRDWYARFKSDYFIFRHKVYINNAGTYLQRDFPVTFAQEPDYELVGNEAWDIRVRLLEAVGAALSTYPDPAAGHPTHFLEETAGFAVAGTWTSGANADASGGNEKTNANANTTDKFRWLYSGYGFRLRGRKASNLGIGQVLLDGVSLGNVDFYAASPTAHAPLLTKTDVVLGLHVVELKATNTKNASSSANTIPADAIEVIP
jgi:alpha-L-fucosidase 2